MSFSPVRTQASIYPPRLRPEHVDHARKRIAAILLADQRSQCVWPLAKIHRARRHHHARVGAWSDHRVAFSASITAAITPASAPRLIFTATPSISSSTALTFDRRRLFGRRDVRGSTVEAASTMAGTNTDAACNGTPYSSISLRSCRRQVNSCEGLSACRRTPAETVSRLEKLSATTDALTSSGQSRRRPAPVKTSKRWTPLCQHHHMTSS